MTCFCFFISLSTLFFIHHQKRERQTKNHLIHARVDDICTSAFDAFHPFWWSECLWLSILCVAIFIYMSCNTIALTFHPLVYTCVSERNWFLCPLNKILLFFVILRFLPIFLSSFSSIRQKFCSRFQLRKFKVGGF